VNEQIALIAANMENAFAIRRMFKSPYLERICPASFLKRRKTSPLNTFILLGSLDKVNIDLRISSVILQKCHFYFPNRLSGSAFPIILYQDLIHQF
jgi:hypothetical protein